MSEHPVGRSFPVFPLQQAVRVTRSQRMSPWQRPDVFALGTLTQTLHPPHSPTPQATRQLSWPYKISQGWQLPAFPPTSVSDTCVDVLPFTGMKSSLCLNLAVRNLWARLQLFLLQASHAHQARMTERASLLDLSKESGVTGLQIIAINMVCVFLLFAFYFFSSEITLDRILIFCGLFTRIFTSSYFRSPHEVKSYGSLKYHYFPQVLLLPLNYQLTK